jgi:hypothetical protein
LGEGWNCVWLELRALPDLRRLRVFKILARKNCLGHSKLEYMRIESLYIFLAVCLASAAFTTLPASLATSVEATTVDAVSAARADRIAYLEARLSELEAGLSGNEATPPTVDVLAAPISDDQARSMTRANATTVDRLSDGVLPDLRWTQPVLWDVLQPGLSRKKVIEQLGRPARALNSFRPYVDWVYFYQASPRAAKKSLRGKISFRNDVVIAVERPNFKMLQSQHEGGTMPAGETEKVL